VVINNGSMTLLGNGTFVGALVEADREVMGLLGILVVPLAVAEEGLTKNARLKDGQSEAKTVVLTPDVVAQGGHFLTAQSPPLNSSTAEGL
jgi:hypothetical protein